MNNKIGQAGLGSQSQPKFCRRRKGDRDGIGDCPYHEVDNAPAMNPNLAAATTRAKQCDRCRRRRL